MEWISVKDRLPNFEIPVLFTNGYEVCCGEYNSKDEKKYFSLSNINVRDLDNREINEETCGFLSEYAPWGKIPFDEVTHWMPLPEPPKKKDLEE